MSERTLVERLRSHHDCCGYMREAADRITALEQARELLPKLLAAARYYEGHKSGWSKADEAHDDAIEAAERLLRADAERNGGNDG